MFLIRPFLFFCIHWAGIQTLFAQNTCSVQDSAQAEVFNQYAKQAEKSARWDSSVYYYQKSKQIFETANCPRGLVKILNNLSISYQRVEQPDNAHATLLQAYTLANQRLLDTDSIKGKTYQLIGMDYFQAQKPDSARFYLNKALQIYQAANAWNSYLRVVKILVQISNFQQQFEQMEQYLIQAESIISSKLQNSPDQLIPILELYGVLYYQKGDYPKALSTTKKALELAQPNTRTRKDTSQLIAYYNNIGLLYTETGDVYNAEHYSNQARALAAQIGDFYQIGVICFNIAELYRERTDFNRALPFYKKGLEALDKLKPNQKTNLGQIDQNNTRAYINLRNGLAKTAIKLNRSLEATNAILANMEAHAKEPYAQEETYRVQGNLFVKLGKYEEAKTSFEESLRLHTKLYGALHPLVSRVYTNMGELYQTLQQPTKALDYFKSAQQSVCYAPCHGEETAQNNNPERLILDKDRYIEALHGQASSNYEMGQIDQAFATTTDLVRLIDKVRNRIKAKTSKLFLQQRVNPIYELRLRICSDKYQQSKDTAWLEEAFRISEKSKSMLLLDGLKNQEALNSGNLPKKFINETRRLEKNIAEQERKLFEAQFSQDKQAVQNIEGALIDLQKKLEQLETDLENDPQYQQYYQIKYKDKQISTAQLQAFLAPQEQLISYFVGSDHYYLISISPKNKKMLQLPKTSATENSLLGLRAALTNTILIRDNPRAAYHLLTKNAWEVYNLFLAPVLDANTKNLLIIPDGMLNYIPFETLLNQPIESTPTDSSYHFGKLPYLLKTHTIRYGYSAGLLFYERASARWWGKILGFAPSYEYTPCETPECLADAAQARQRIIRNQVGDLPGAQRELEWLDKTFGGNFLYGKNANEANFKKLAQNQSYSIIHLAMHGWVDDNNPDFSNLVLSQTQNNTDSEDGLLHSYELDLMSLSADLVVLSACETGFGRYARGEGVQSLGRGFMHAGVPSLAMSLWAINDQSTAILMQHFYKHLADGKPKDEALALAKQAYLELVDDKSGHPFFWAAIVLVGDNTPLSMWKDWYLWAMLSGAIVGGACLFYLGFRYWKKSSPQKV